MTNEYVAYHKRDKDIFDEKLTLEDITLYDLMSEDYTIWLKKNKDFGLSIMVEREDGERIVQKMVHPEAVRGFAVFCQNFLNEYKSNPEYQDLFT